jgi:pimeloyl-ACP methyl ester carboxylesterase
MLCDSHETIGLSQTLMFEGNRLGYTVSGSPDAPPLIMIHGFLSHRGIWWQTMKTLQNRYYCIGMDLLGFGQSDKPADGDYSIEAQGKRLLQLADACGCERFALLGHSLGGQIALYVAALLAPARVTCLISVAGIVTGHLTPLVEHLIYPQLTLGAVFPELYAWWRWLAHYPYPAYTLFRPWFHKMDCIPFECWAVDREMAFQPGVQYSAYPTARAIRRLNLTPHLATLTVPSLVIFGRQDHIVPLSEGLLIQQHVPHSRLVVLDQCGHFPMYEQAQCYLDTVCGFLPA